MGRSFNSKHGCPAGFGKKTKDAKNKKSSSPTRALTPSSSPSPMKEASGSVAKSPKAGAPGGIGVKASDCDGTDAGESESSEREEEKEEEDDDKGSDHEDDDYSPIGE